jgi:hypothetical protein
VVAINWFVGGKDVVEGTVFTHDNDHVLDGGRCGEAGSSVVCGFVFGVGVLHHWAKEALRHRDQS